MWFSILQLRAERDDDPVHAVFGEHRFVSGPGNIRRIQPIDRECTLGHDFGKVAENNSIIANLEIMPALLPQGGYNEGRLLIELEYFRQFITGRLISADRLRGGMIQ